MERAPRHCIPSDAEGSELKAMRRVCRNWRLDIDASITDLISRSIQPLIVLSLVLPCLTDQIVNSKFTLFGSMDRIAFVWQTNSISGLIIM